MNFRWLSQFGYRLAPTLAPAGPPAYVVQAYRPESPSGGKWLLMTQYTKYFPDSNYVGAYFDDLCRRGRSLAPTVTSKSLFSSKTRNFPVIIKQFMKDASGNWVLQRECQK